MTMLQRSPSYVASLPSRDVVADGLRAVLPDAVAHRLVRGKNVLLSTAGYQVLRRYPQAGRRMLRRRAARLLPEGYPVDTHFAPALRPLGPAAVRRPRRRPVRRAVRRTGPGRDRRHRAVRARRHPAGSAASCSRPTSS